MRLATRRLHALDNVAPLTFPVCDICDKAIMAQPYEVDGKSYHQGGCLIELGHRVTEEIWKAKEAARIAAAERAKMYEKPTYRPAVTYQPFTTLDTSGPLFGGAGSGSVLAGWVVGGGVGGNISNDGNTIFLPTSVVTTGGTLLSSMAVGTATSHTHPTSSHTHSASAATTFEVAGSWDTVAIADGEAVAFSATVNL